MGIVNVTPDSFFDGGAHDDVVSAVSHGLKLLAEGAEILDIGGESTRPGFHAVSVEEEIRRVVPVVRELRCRTDAVISVDTMKADVAAAAFQAGADLLNDVTGLGQEFEQKCQLLKQYGAGCAVMHWQPRPQGLPDGDYVGWAVGVVRQQIVRAMASTGLDASHFMADPGIGFGKTDWENLELLRRLDEFHDTGCAVLLGISRKSFIRRATGQQDVAGCLSGTGGATALGAWFGADVHRVHDVREMRDVLAVVEAVAAHGEMEQQELKLSEVR